MPTTLAGLLVFVVMLVPGFVFITIYTWNRPRRRWSTVEETAAILLASVVADAAVATIYAGFRARSWIDGPTLYRLIHEPDRHLGWVATLLAVSSVLPVAVALPMRLRPVHSAVTSSWWTLFQLWRKGAEYRTVHIRCELDDGSRVTGFLGDWNSSIEESGDRDLILGDPIGYRPPGGQEYLQEGVSVACISARRIVAMFVTYSGGASPTSAQAEAAEVAAEGEAAALETSLAQSRDADSAYGRRPGPASAHG